VTLDVEAENVAGVRARLVGVVRKLHAPGLAPPADLHLRLDDDGIPDTVGRGDGLVDRLGDITGRNGNAVAGEELLALILEQVQIAYSLVRCGLDANRGRSELRQSAHSRSIPVLPVGGSDHTNTE
jgi:hypothetical protein